jgi:hypothetical protein
MRRSLTQSKTSSTITTLRSRPGHDARYVSVLSQRFQLISSSTFHRPTREVDERQILPELSEHKRTAEPASCTTSQALSRHFGLCSPAIARRSEVLARADLVETRRRRLKPRQPRAPGSLRPCLTWIKTRNETKIMFPSS